MIRNAQRLHRSWRATAIVLALLAMALAVIVVASSHRPVISQRIGETALHFTADRAWSLHAGDCVTLQWQVEGIESLYVEGSGVAGHGEQAYCPVIDDSTARFDVRTPDGIYREYDLRIHYLPDLLFYLAAFVGVVGSLAIIAFLVLTNPLDRAWNPRWVVVCLAALAVAGTALRLNETPPPRLEADDGQVKVAMWAEHSTLAFPQEPVDVEFSVAGARTVRHLGEAVEFEDGWAQRTHRVEHGSAFTLELTGADGVAREHSLPIPSLFGALGQTPVFHYWCLFALFCAALVYMPMAWRKWRAIWKRRDWTDAMSLGGFLFLALAVHAPFGLDSPPIWETWEQWTYIEGRLYMYSPEFPTRFFELLPISLAHFIDNDSYTSFHLLHLATLALLPGLFYGVLRKLGVRALYAFLLAALFFAYPVNDLRMSPRFLVNNASIMWLLLAAHCALDWLESGRRQSLAGAALALLFNVGSYEMGLAIVAAAPFFLWLRPGKRDWRRVNLSLLFWCAAAFKFCYMALLLTTDRPLYQQRVADALLSGGGGEAPGALLERLAQVYERVFVTGWGDALAALAGGEWLAAIAVALLGFGAVGLWLARRDAPASRLSLRSNALAFAGGLCLIVPAVILLLPTRYGEGEMTRIMFYTPFGGAVAVFSLLPLAALRIAPRWRDSALIALCLVLLLPGLSWLFAQQDRWTGVADNQGRVLRQIVELVPRPLPGVHITLVSDMTTTEMETRQIWRMPLKTLAYGALRVLYKEDAPLSAQVCLLRYSDAERCRVALEPAAADVPRLSQTIFMELHRDLTVELLDDPAARLGWNIDIDYNASRLHDADAPIPERARTMLSAHDPPNGSA